MLQPLLEEVWLLNRKPQIINVHHSVCNKDKVARTTTTAALIAGDFNNCWPLSDNVPSVSFEVSVMYVLKTIDLADLLVDYCKNNPGTNTGFYHDHTKQLIH